MNTLFSRNYSIFMFFSGILFLFFLSTTFSYSVFSGEFIQTETSSDLFIEETSFRISPKDSIINQEITLYVTVKNSSLENMKGVIRAFDVTEKKKIDIEQTFTALSHSKGNVFFNYTPQQSGTHEVAIRMIPWEDYKGNTDKTNDKITKQFFVDLDTDNDGKGNLSDTDDDNDGVIDSNDLFPLNKKESTDYDNDGIGDNEDTDDDNDGIEDTDDAFPLDAAENNDTDGDGVGNNDDDDDDGDGIRDSAEQTTGTDPLKKDTDDDGVDDGIDVYPLDHKYQYDTDKDGIPNQKDDDDDNDGTPDSIDKFPLDKNEWADFDNDNIGDFADPDDDNDKLLDEAEKKIGSDPFDADTDKDGVIDGEDAIPTDASETLDSDNDGIGDNADTNDQNKGPVIVSDYDFSAIEIDRGELLSIDTSKSYDPEGGGVYFLWEIINSDKEIVKSSNEEVFQVIFWGTGERTIRLTITDVADEKRVKEFTVSVKFSQKDWWIALGVTLFLIFMGGGIVYSINNKEIFRKKKRI